MPLTLNSNSFTIGGPSSGLDDTGALNLIKNNTPWQYIETITAGGSSTLDLTNSNIANFDAFYIHFDNINLSETAQTRLRLYLDDSLKTDNSYRFTTIMGSNTSNTTSGGSGNDFWIFGGQSYSWMRNITGAMYINGKAGSIKVLKSDLGAGNSGNSAMRHSCGGIYNSSESNTITGFNFSTSTGNYSSGQLHLYGMNKHD